MIISIQSIQELREIINEKSMYRSGPKIVEFFNSIGLNETYTRGFPSRWEYTDKILERINGTPELDKAIKEVFNPRNYIGNFALLEKLIHEFNEYLSFDGWLVERKNTEIVFTKAKGVDLDSKLAEEANADIELEKFMSQQFYFDCSASCINDFVRPSIEQRIDEINRCLQAEAPLSVIFLCGSTLEGLLLSVATTLPKLFNTSASAAKSNGKVRPFPEWKLSNFIDVATELTILCKDVQKFSHVLRDFRNYIHPFQQSSENFTPTMDTALICVHVLKAASVQITKYFSNN